MMYCSHPDDVVLLYTIYIGLSHSLFVAKLTKEILDYN